MSIESNPQSIGDIATDPQVAQSREQDHIIRPEESNASYDPNIDRARLRAYVMDPYVTEAITQRNNARKALSVFEEDKYIPHPEQVYENATKRGELAMKAMQKADLADARVSAAYDSSVAVASNFINGKRPEN